MSAIGRLGVLASALALAVPATVVAADGGFGASGRVVGSFGEQGVFVAGGVARNGGIVLGGHLNRPGGEGGRVVAIAYRRDGKVYRRFGVRGVARAPLSGAVTTSAVAGHAGKVVVAGVSRSRDEVIVARFTARGRPDRAFGDGGVVRLAQHGFATVRAIAVGRRGDIAVGGGIARGSALDPAVWRLRADGAPAAFGSDGRLVVGGPVGVPDAPDQVAALALRPDRGLRAVTTGNDALHREAGFLRVLRIGAAGGVEAGPVVARDGEVSSSVLTAAGDLLVAGSDRRRFALRRFTAAGAPDARFGGGDGLTSIAFGDRMTSTAQALLLRGGKVTLAGWTARLDLSGARFALARFDARTGQVDRGFGGRGRLQTTFRGRDAVARAVVGSGRSALIAAGSGYARVGAPADRVAFLARYRLR
jgi:hypothetical protein